MPLNKPLPKLLLGLAASAVLASVFLAYTRPEFLVMLSNELWACF